MLTTEENQLLCRVGPGTPMGDLMRQYWLPAVLSSELPEPDCAPVRVLLLGEDLIAFRDSTGRVGLIANSCPHRGASLFFGRNEEAGLRCVYHGWKFDVSGQCVDMPGEPAESSFKDKIRAVAYPCVERHGAIWAYLGPRTTPPPLPDLEANMVEGSRAELVQRHCNWTQALEGDIDTAHFGFLHRSLAHTAPPGTYAYYMDQDPSPHFAVVDTEAGTTYGAYRPAEADSYYWRIANFLFPCFTMIPTGVLGAEVRFRAWVPLDDENTMYWSFLAPRALPPEANGVPPTTAGGFNAGQGGRIGYDYLPNTSDWLGRFRLLANESNDYHIDREAQRTQSYTGIDEGSATLQDQAITESMGPIFDRTQEHLGTSDAMIMRTRQRLIAAARALRDAGVTPPGVDDPHVYRVRAGGVVLPRDADWVETTRDLRRAFVVHEPANLAWPKSPLPLGEG